MGEKMTPCAECGMPCEPGEYHPYAACLMFKGCHNSTTVRANLTQPAQAVDGWQPIETAPKDGTAVLVMRNLWPGCPNGVAESCNGHNTYVAEFWSEMGVSGAWICYMDQVSEPRCPVEPTHWRPLPTPPAALPNANGKEGES